MDQKYLYLWLNILSFIFPFAFSFHPRYNFAKKWRFVLPAILFTAIIFIVWDEIFTKMGVWGFNQDYLTGISIMSLPLEEVMFFFCIPYACMFTYFALGSLMKKDPLYAYQEIISSVIIVLSLVVSIYYLDRCYTAVTVFSLAIFLALQMLKVKPNYMGRFYIAFAIILIPFLIVNGILTGSFIDKPVVWYNNLETVGIRIGTIPVEDVFYALLLLVMNVTIAEALEQSAWSKKNSPAFRAMK